MAEMAAWMTAAAAILPKALTEAEINAEWDRIKDKVVW